MGRLSSEHILKEKKTEDSNSIVSLSLTHKALSDVSCLGVFKNLEKLDLKMNNLTSLEGLRECSNLKWLSAVENKLRSLKGIEGLTKLTVLNAGKNKIRSIEEVQNLLNLRALIVNDNEIVSVCKLDRLKELNTVVFSRNPIRKMSFGEMKPITKISLSSCHLEEIDSSIKGCAELKELRLAHNDIKTIPEVLSHNTRLQLLDLGNNVISRWSDLKVLSSLHSLRNLNLQGNPIAEKDKLLKKVKKWIPGLQIFNAKPIEKQHMNKKSESNEVDSDVGTGDHDDGFKRKRKGRESGLEGKSSEQKEDSALEHKKNSKRVPKEAKESNGSDLITDEDGTRSDERKGKKEKKKKNMKEHNEEEGSGHEVNGGGSGKKLKRKADEKTIDDDEENPFPEHKAIDNKRSDLKRREEKSGGSRAAQNHDSLSALIIEPSKKKKMKKLLPGSSELEVLAHGMEVGLGGPSAWGD